MPSKPIFLKNKSSATIRHHLKLWSKNNPRALGTMKVFSKPVENKFVIWLDSQLVKLFNYLFK